MVASWRPDFSIQGAFDVNPNDPVATPTWSDLSRLFLGAQQVQRGRQYELDQNQASQPASTSWIRTNI